MMELEYVMKNKLFAVVGILFRSITISRDMAMSLLIIIGMSLSAPQSEERLRGRRCPL